MNKIFKFLKKRTKSERLKLIFVVKLIAQDKLDGLDIEKKKDSRDTFRVRIGKFRIIFQQSKKENIVLAIKKRDDRTYKN